MNEIFYSIDPGVFLLFPLYMRGVVLAHDVHNGPSSQELVALLRSEEQELRHKITSDNLTEHPRIRNWREAFRTQGIKPSEFRPSIEAMARRVLRGDELPSINALVDIGNLVSLRHLIPAGGHALDGLTQDISLRLADGSEEFCAFGSQTSEHPEPGEIIFAEGNVVLTRRWVWRQSNHTLTLPETRSIEFNIDALPPLERPDVESICEEVSGLVRQFCGGKTRFEILDRQHPHMSLADR